MSETEISDFMDVVVDEYVGEFKVAVDDAVG
jgi:hypothetical protein